MAVKGGMNGMRFRLRRTIRAVLAALAAAALLSGSALASVACYINEDAKLYSYPDHAAASVGVPEGLSCELSAIDGDWALVTRADASAFIPLRFLTLCDPIEAYAAQAAPVYAAADSASQRLGTVPAGTAVSIVGRDGSFFRIEGNAAGYVPASALSQQPPQVPEDAGEDGGAPRSNRAGTVIALAKSLCGAAYSDDPQPPERFDAGSFVAYCFAQAGVVLSPSPRAQGFDGDFAAITNTESLAPGDIVCFDTKSDGSLVDHTGIYVGGGYFVHASASAGQVVASSLASGYYRNAFSWGRRVLA